MHFEIEHLEVYLELFEFRKSDCFEGKEFFFLQKKESPK